MISKPTYFVCLLLMVYSSLCFYPRWQQSNTEATISWDVSGYYWYLPSVFIYKDLKHQAFKDSIIHKYRPDNLEFQQGFLCDNGNYVMKYASGMSLLYFPLFITAHVLAPYFGYPADGFSAPYQLAIQIGGLLFALLGLWYLRKLLRMFYNDHVVAIVLLLLVAGSNYLNYAAIDTGMTHSWIFTLYVFLLLNTIKFYQKPNNKRAIYIGLLVGLATLIRPTEIISCLIPLLWGLEGISGTIIRQRLSFIRTHITSFLMAIACASVVISIQLFYWKYVSGHWIVYSYQDQGFSWLHPHIKRYLFDYKSGWLIYSPMMMLSFAGIIPFIMTGKNRLAIMVFFLLNLYIVSAWDIWWYGGRAMVQSYPILLFPMASLISAMLQKNILKLVLVPFILLFLYFNIWITYHYHKTTIYDSECMNKAYFWKVAGRWEEPTEAVIKLKDGADYYDGKPENLQLIYTNNFDHDTASHCTLPPIEGRSVCVDKMHQYSPAYTTILPEGHKWVRAQATFRCQAKEWDVWKMTVFNIRFFYKGATQKTSCIRLYRFLNDGDTKDLFLDALTPKTNCDSVSVFLDNAGSDKPLEMDNLRIWTFN